MLQIKAKLIHDQLFPGIWMHIYYICENPSACSPSPSHVQGESWGSPPGGGGMKNHPLPHCKLLILREGQLPIQF